MAGSHRREGIGYRAAVASAGGDRRAAGVVRTQNGARWARETRERRIRGRALYFYSFHKAYRSRHGHVYTYKAVPYTRQESRFRGSYHGSK